VSLPLKGQNLSANKGVANGRVAINQIGNAHDGISKKPFFLGPIHRFHKASSSVENPKL
jgi:hypothetical protein